MRVGEIIPGDAPIVGNQGRRTIAIRVKNLSDRPIQVSSHYHFFEANRKLKFDREKAFGMRLDLPAGGRVMFDPGEEKEVTLVEFAGRKEIWGFNGLVNGPLTPHTLKAALRRAEEKGFWTQDID
ncbi:MAG: urease subunit beta [Candidatus Tectomicrobia bacterium]|nr:urease subunit beta [Candidatus Tectomicrobia bacterium]